MGREAGSRHDNYNRFKMHCAFPVGLHGEKLQDLLLLSRCWKRSLLSNSDILNFNQNKLVQQSKYSNKKKE